MLRSLLVSACFLLPLTAGAASAAIGAFNQDLEVRTLDDVAASCGSAKMWIPEGSAIVTNDDLSLTIVPPEGWVYVGVNDGIFQDSPSTCSCLCTAGESGDPKNPPTCTPSVFRGNCSCTAKNGCTSCSLTTSLTLVDGFATEVSAGGYVNLEAGVRLLDEGESIPAAFATMFEVPEIQEGLESFLADLYADGPVPELHGEGTSQFFAPLGYTFAPVNVFGRAAFVLVPRTAGLFNRTEGSCGCTEGTCTFKKQWTPQGTLYYCDGSCTGTCTLTMGLRQGRGLPDGLDSAEPLLQFDRSSQ